MRLLIAYILTFLFFFGAFAGSLMGYAEFDSTFAKTIIHEGSFNHGILTKNIPTEEDHFLTEIDQEEEDDERKKLSSTDNLPFVEHAFSTYFQSDDYAVENVIPSSFQRSQRRYLLFEVFRI